VALGIGALALVFAACSPRQWEPASTREGPGGKAGAQPVAGAVARPTPRSSAASSEARARILRAIDRMESGHLGVMSVPRADGELLRSLVLGQRAMHVVEIGTSTGYSGLWLLLGLLETGGRLTTFEFDAGRARKAREIFAEAGMADRVVLVEGDAHEKVSTLKAGIDLVFIDADKEGYLDYLKKLLPLVRPGGLVVAHNMQFPRPDPRYLKAVTTDPALSTVFLNMDGPGVGVTQKKR
jgi:predicted O-methyltransferase YrrM